MMREIEEMINAKIAELTESRSFLEQWETEGWEFKRPEQDAQAAMYRLGWRQSMDGVNQQLAFYQQQLLDAHR